MNDQSSPASDHDRSGWGVLSFPLAAFGLGALVPIVFMGLGWVAAASITSMLGLIALPASAVYAIVVAIRSWRDRPSLRNRALGDLGSAGCC
jgi:hypothetical protein